MLAPTDVVRHTVVGSAGVILDQVHWDDQTPSKEVMYL
jgi:hypothetical protein